MKAVKLHRSQLDRTEGVQLHVRFVGSEPLIAELEMWVTLDVKVSLDQHFEHRNDRTDVLRRLGHG